MFLEIWMILVLGAFWFISMFFYGGYAYQFGKRAGVNELAMLIVDDKTKLEYRHGDKRYIIEHREID